MESGLVSTCFKLEDLQNSKVYLNKGSVVDKYPYNRDKYAYEDNHKKKE